MLFLLSSAYAQNNEVFVATNGSDISGNGSQYNPYQTIKMGISQIKDNGTIHIANGNYNGDNNTNLIIDRSMTISGESQTGTIIDGTNKHQIFYIYNSSSLINVILQNLTFINGNANNGGAIFSNGTLTVNDCTFTNNIATNDIGGGGAIYSDMNCDLNLNGCTFTNNKANVSGGAIYYIGDIFNVNNCTFTSNNAIEGGAIFTLGGISTINESSFINNKAYEAGGIHGSGGAILNSGGDHIITDCIFSGNYALVGGAFQNSDGFSNATNCIFLNNKADDCGGAIGNGDSTLNITSCIFTGNIAPNGAMIDNGGQVIIIGCNIYNNTATNGSVINSLANSIVKYSRIVGNTMPDVTEDDLSLDDQFLDLRFNWWGSNNGPEPGRIVGKNVTYAPWLIMTINADPSTINQGYTSKIAADVYKDSEGTDHSADRAQFFNGPEVTFKTNLGDIGSESVTKAWAFGKAAVILRANEGSGIAIITATDVQTVSTKVIILANTINQSGKTIAMKNTGLPIFTLVLAIFGVISGLLIPRRKK